MNREELASEYWELESALSNNFIEGDQAELAQQRMNEIETLFGGDVI